MMYDTDFFRNCPHITVVFTLEGIALTWCYDGHHLCGLEDSIPQESTCGLQTVAPSALNHLVTFSTFFMQMAARSASMWGNQSPYLLRSYEGYSAWQRYSNCVISAAIGSQPARMAWTRLSKAGRSWRTHLIQKDSKLRSAGGRLAAIAEIAGSDGFRWSLFSPVSPSDFPPSRCGI